MLSICCQSYLCICRRSHLVKQCREWCIRTQKSTRIKCLYFKSGKRSYAQQHMVGSGGKLGGLLCFYVSAFTHQTLHCIVGIETGWTMFCHSRFGWLQNHLMMKVHIPSFSSLFMIVECKPSDGRFWQWSFRAEEVYVVIRGRVLLSFPSTVKNMNVFLSLPGFPYFSFPLLLCYNHLYTFFLPLYFAS